MRWRECVDRGHIRSPTGTDTLAMQRPLSFCPTRSYPCTGSGRPRRARCIRRYSDRERAKFSAFSKNASIRSACSRLQTSFGTSLTRRACLRTKASRSCRFFSRSNLNSILLPPDLQALHERLQEIGIERLPEQYPEIDRILDILVAPEIELQDQALQNRGTISIGEELQFTFPVDKVMLIHKYTT